MTKNSLFGLRRIEAEPRETNGLPIHEPNQPNGHDAKLLDAYSRAVIGLSAITQINHSSH